jgi:hypothetical protein
MKPKPDDKCRPLVPVSQKGLEDLAAALLKSPEASQSQNTNRRKFRIPGEFMGVTSEVAL